VAIASVDPAGYETAQEQQYIIDVTRDTGMVSTTPTEINDLIGAAHGACRAMAAGETPGQLIDVLATPPHPMPYGVATALVYDAIKDLCPYTAWNTATTTKHNNQSSPWSTRKALVQGPFYALFAKCLCAGYLREHDRGSGDGLSRVCPRSPSTTAQTSCSPAKHSNSGFERALLAMTYFCGRLKLDSTPSSSAPAVCPRSIMRSQKWDAGCVRSLDSNPPLPDPNSNDL
jgi:Protein of unknown function (DUF732)